MMGSSEGRPPQRGAAHHAAGERQHDHDHDHALRSTSARRLRIALALTATFMVVEAVAGVLSRSLALLSDSAHMLTDAVALGIAVVAQSVARRPRTAVHTYGARRVETLAAFVNGVLLGLSSFGIAAEALRRWSRPPEVEGGALLGVATLGLAVNLLAAWVLSRGRGGHNVNTRAAFAHVMADAAGSVGAIVAGLLVKFLGWHRADPAISLVISALILWSAWGFIADTTRVLMEAAPEHVDVPALGATIGETPGVSALHDLHVWTVAEGFAVVTVHVVLDGVRHGAEVSREVGRRVAEAHGITHVTVQAEAPTTAVVPASRLRRGEGPASGRE